MQNQLEKAINLAKKTGDRVIVVDKAQPDDTFVVMSLDEYEKLVIGHSEVRSLTEDELLDKINRDIAIWKSENNNSELENQKVERKRDRFESNFEDDMKDMEDDEDDLYYYNHEPFSVFQDKNFLNGVNNYDDDYEGDRDNGIKEPKNHWSIPSNIKDRAEEVIEDIKI
ncbi:MAG: hypothetical protein ABIE43_00675 [Patescibacteria group bacterium]